MVTTIKIHEDTKRELDLVKKRKESYDDTLQRILEIERKRNISEKLVEGYKSMSRQEFEEFKEWDQLE